MNRKNNKVGPDCDVGFLMSGRPRDGTGSRPRDGTGSRPRDGTGSRPRDGTGSRPRDGTGRRPRDGTERRPRDGTRRKPRDETMLRKGSLVIRYYYRITKQPQDVRIHGRPSSKRRKPWWGKPALWTGAGEVCPEENEE